MQRTSPGARVHELIHRLANRSLASVVANGGLRLHDLQRDFVRKRAAPRSPPSKATAARSRRWRRSPTAASSPVAALADGRVVSGADDDRTLKVWDLESGAAVATPEGHRGAVRAVAALADGSTTTNRRKLISPVRPLPAPMAPLPERTPVPWYDPAHDHTRRGPRSPD